MSIKCQKIIIKNTEILSQITRGDIMNHEDFKYAT